MKTTTYIALLISTLAITFLGMYFLMTRLLMLPRDGTIAIMVPTLIMIVPIVVAAMIEGQRKCIDARHRRRMPMSLVEKLTKLTFIGICTATTSMLALGSIIYYENKYIGLFWCVIASAAALYLYRKTLDFKEQARALGDA